MILHDVKLFIFQATEKTFRYGIISGPSPAIHADSNGIEDLFEARFFFKPVNLNGQLSDLLD